MGDTCAVLAIRVSGYMLDFAKDHSLPRRIAELGPRGRGTSLTALGNFWESLAWFLGVGGGT